MSRWGRVTNDFCMFLNTMEHNFCNECLHFINDFYMFLNKMKHNFCNEFLHFTYLLLKYRNLPMNTLLLRVNETLIECKQKRSLDQSRDNDLFFSSLAMPCNRKFIIYEVKWYPSIHRIPIK